MSDELARLIDSVPNIGKLPKYKISTEANLDLLKKDKTEFSFSNKNLSTDIFDEIAKTITTVMKSFKPV